MNNGNIFLLNVPISSQKQILLVLIKTVFNIDKSEMKSF